MPVLSEAMTVAEPSVSTAGSFRTIAPRRAIRCTPIASTSVTIAAKPSGTAATASATPNNSASTTVRASKTPSATSRVVTTTNAITITAMPRRLPVRSSSRCSGVGSVLACFQQARYPPQLGVHSCSEHHCSTMAVGHCRTREHDIAPVAERSGISNWLSVFRGPEHFRL